MKREVGGGKKSAFCACVLLRLFNRGMETAKHVT